MLLSLAAVLSMLVPVSGLAVAEGDSEEVNESRGWAVYLYCGADNDMEEATEFALEQCVKALADDGSDPDSLYVVALVDRRSSEGTWVYELTPEGLGTPVSGWADHERDTTDPGTLSDFLDFAMEMYPAENTLLVVKNGHAWCGVCPDWTEQDETYLMPIDGLASAVAGRGIDVVALDGDNMASVEVAYELRHSTRYFVGTQQDIPLDGLPYYLFVKDIADGERKYPLMPEAEELARSIVYNYVLYYNNTDGKKTLMDHLLSNSQMAVTAAAFDMGDEGENMDAIVESFTDIINYMMYGVLPGEELGDDPEPTDWVPTYRDCIASARDSALIGKMADQAGYEWLPDVYQWFDMLVDLVNYEEVRDDVLPGLVQQFHDDFDAALMKMEQCQILNRSGNSWPHGLNIWFPPTPTQWESLDYTRERTYLYDGSLVELPAEYYCIDCPIDYDELGLDFVSDTPWMDFFELYYDSRWVIYGNPDAPKETPLWSV